jgi:hypothetical protein
MNDMFVKSSTRCSTSTASGSALSAFTYAFTWSNVSNWWKQNAKYEKDTFLILIRTKMKHFDSNVNRTGKFRFGRGRNFYSYIIVLGESMPPQINVDKPFVDEMWQTMVPRIFLISQTSSTKLETTSGTACLGLLAEPCQAL